MDITYDGAKELIVHRLYKVSPDELAKTAVSIFGGSKPAYWHDGILFIFQSIPLFMNNGITDDYLKGKEHWQEVYYSELERPRESFEIEDGEFKGAKVRVVTASGFSPHREFAEWVKKNRDAAGDGAV